MSSDIVGLLVNQKSEEISKIMSNYDDRVCCYDEIKLLFFSLFLSFLITGQTFKRNEF